MGLKVFKQSLADPEPPTDFDLALKALWYEAKGEWDKAHESVQREQSQAAAWVHAYLHRKEGDQANAAYWYQRARKPISDLPLPDESAEILASLLSDLESR